MVILSYQYAELLYERVARSDKWFARIASDNVYRPHAFTGWLKQREDLIDDIKDFLNMAKKSERKKATWKSFVNVDIPYGDRESAKEVILDADKTVERVSDLVSQGYKLSVSYSASNDSFIATLTGAYADLPNAGLSMSGFGKDWIVALGSVCYKHFDVSKGTWSSGAKSDSELFG